MQCGASQQAVKHQDPSNNHCRLFINKANFRHLILLHCFLVVKPVSFSDFLFLFLKTTHLVLLLSPFWLTNEVFCFSFKSKGFWFDFHYRFWFSSQNSKPQITNTQLLSLIIHWKQLTYEVLVANFVFKEQHIGIQSLILLALFFFFRSKVFGF